jgi:c-di-GMP-binding flagellar brake protein YcgR
MKRFSDNTKPMPEREYERRVYLRYKVHKIVTYTYRGKQLLTVTVDLGMGGMKIKTHYKLPEDEGMNFKIVLGDNFISPEGTVVYSRTLPDKNRVSGIQFLGLSRQDSALLRANLAAMKK